MTGPAPKAQPKRLTCGGAGMYALGGPVPTGKAPAPAPVPDETDAPSPADPDYPTGKDAG